MHEDTKEPRKNLDWLRQQEVNVKLEILQQHLEICRMVIHQLLDDEVTMLAGSRYKRTKPHNGRYSRWGTNPGSVRIDNQRLPVQVPRVYDRHEQRNQQLENYQKLKEIARPSETLMQAVLHGIGTRNYHRAIATLTDSFGISKSAVSEEFKERSAAALQEFFERDFSEETIVALFIDGKALQKRQMVIALGVNKDGKKIPMGFIEATTENAASITEMLRDFIRRGFRYAEGILVVVDGGKGIRKAVEKVFGDSAVVVRCYWHKRENILSYLPESIAPMWRRKITEVFTTLDYEQAQKKYKTLQEELERENVSAARSLEEGGDELFTLQRLGIAEQFQRSFSTTNCIENLNSQIERYVRPVRYWKTSDQRHRWIALALMESESHMRSVCSASKINTLYNAVKAEVQKRKNECSRPGRTSTFSTKKRT